MTPSSLTLSSPVVQIDFFNWKFKRSREEKEGCLEHTINKLLKQFIKIIKQNIWAG